MQELPIEDLRDVVKQGIEARKLQIKENNERVRLNQTLAMLQNTRALGTITRIAAGNENLTRLSVIAQTMNELPPIRLKGVDARTVSVNVFQTAKSVFGEELSRLIGIVESIDGALDDHKFEMLAITGLEPALVVQTVEAIGRRPYYSKQQKAVIDGHVGNAETAKICLELCMEQMELNPIKLSTVTQPTLQSVYDYALSKANQALAAQEELEALNELTV